MLLLSRFIYDTPRATRTTRAQRPTVINQLRSQVYNDRVGTTDCWLASLEGPKHELPKGVLTPGAGESFISGDPPFLTSSFARLQAESLDHLAP